MNLLEKNIANILEDLKENYQAVSVKAEFGAEGANIDEAFKLKEFAINAKLDSTIKIGGCEAVRDLQDAKKIDVSMFVSPMIETSYAMKKYVNSLQNVFSKEELYKRVFLINIETYTGYANIDSIIESTDFDTLDGIVLGRSDMAASMELQRKEIDSDMMLTMAQAMSLKMMNLNKKMIVGGGISVHSVPFLAKIPYLTNFETRKVIFDADILKNLKQAEDAILKAIEFERLWIVNRRENYGIIHNDDNERLIKLEKYVNDSLKI